MVTRFIAMILSEMNSAGTHNYPVSFSRFVSRPGNAYSRFVVGLMPPQGRALRPSMRDLPLSRSLDALAGFL